ncbi:glucose-6-phosphate isomerase [Meridianimarinicoccus aquatilis]|uniref:Glucose-6-phosphate isomerase n=1 Tax=Meridianimarinicoccus aquatilis TaxID=2552766 RepID=A0A4R6AYW6_9RHOB|nr:glucose-6-phosphate isomerase [Fluviibacterium aquatile]QIE41842.1 glucose-6-phosphate isomerase [Rhodobacteraceae bacterium SC52]TDL89447.1 glucose-6-phosphate isomerase [Fluviibacterium aquatile]
MTTKHFAAAALAATLTLTACADQNTTNQVGTGVAGGAIAAIAATALGANSGWTAVAAGAGAIAGSLYARNQQTGECAYHTGDGSTVTVGGC